MIRVAASEAHLQLVCFGFNFLQMDMIKSYAKCVPVQNQICAFNNLNFILPMFRNKTFKNKLSSAVEYQQSSEQENALMIICDMQQTKLSWPQLFIKLYIKAKQKDHGRWRRQKGKKLERLNEHCTWTRRKLTLLSWFNYPKYIMLSAWWYNQQNYQAKKNRKTKKKPSGHVIVCSWGSQVAVVSLCSHTAANTIYVDRNTLKNV